MGQRPFQPLDGLSREPGARGVQAAQVAVEVLAVGVDPQLGVVGLPGRAVAAELGKVRVQREQRDLARQDGRPNGLVASGQIGGQGVGRGVGVVAHQMG